MHRPCRRPRPCAASDRLPVHGHAAAVPGCGSPETRVSRPWSAIGVLAIIVGALESLGRCQAARAHRAGQTTPQRRRTTSASSPAARRRVTLSSPSRASSLRARHQRARSSQPCAPSPYAFVGVTAAAGDRSFVLLAVGPTSIITDNDPYGSSCLTYPQQFLVLRIHPSGARPTARAQLTALPQTRSPERTRGRCLEFRALARS